jgi:hypothetical protein
VQANRRGGNHVRPQRVTPLTESGCQSAKNAKSRIVALPNYELPARLWVLHFLCQTGATTLEYYFTFMLQWVIHSFERRFFLPSPDKSWYQYHTDFKKVAKTVVF